jgi:hypothetical protein
LEAEGEVIFDMLEGASRDPSPAPTPKATKAAKGRWPRSREEEKELLFQEFERRRAESTTKEKAKEDRPTSKGHSSLFFTGKRGSFATFCKGSGRLCLTKMNVPKEVGGFGCADSWREETHKRWDTHVRKLENDGIKENKITWKEFKGFMCKRYDSADTVAQSKAKAS